MVDTYNGIVPNYSQQPQFAMTEKQLYELGFSQEDVNSLKFVMNNGLKITLPKLQEVGMTYEYAKKIKYMYDILTRKVVIENKEEFASHLKKMFGQHKRICIDDLVVKDKAGNRVIVDRVPRWALVGGIKDEVYEVLNSKNYHPTERMYRVVECSNSRVIIETDRKIVIKYGYPKKIQGVLEILGKEKKTGKTFVAIDKSCCKLVNRYIIVASLKKPKTHHGMVEILCTEGSKVYVYAVSIGNRQNVNYQGGNSRIFDFGYMPSEIKPKLMSVASNLYKNVHGIKHFVYGPDSDFNILVDERKENEIEVNE